MATAPSIVDVPFLTVNAESPADFASGSADVAAITMPTGALIALVLRFELSGGSKVSDYHIFDMSLPQHADWWNTARAAGGSFAISIENAAKQQAARLDLTLDRDVLARLLDGSTQALAGLAHVDGPRAVADFKAVFQTASERHADQDAAWRAALDAVASGTTGPAVPGQSFVSVFALPTGALIACWTQVRAADGRALFGERVFDLSAAADREAIASAAAAGAIAVDVDDPAGKREQYRVTVDGKTLTDYANAAGGYLAKIPLTNAAKARADFAALGAEARQQHADLAQAWQRLNDTVSARTNEFIQRFNELRDRDIARRKIYYYFARTIQIVSAIPVLGPYLVLFIVPTPIVLLLLLVPDIRSAADANPEIASLLIMVPLTLWAGWLHGAGILRVDLPLPIVEVPVWAGGILVVAGSLLALLSGS